MRLFQDSHGLGRSSVAAPGPGSHTLPQLLGRQCLHPIACLLLRPFSDGCSGMPYNFPAHVFILNMSYVVIKLSVTSLVFQEFYMATIFIDDKVKLMIFWTQSQCFIKHCRAVLTFWLSCFSTPGSDGVQYETHVNLVCNNSSQPPRGMSKCSTSVPSRNFISHSDPAV